MVVSLTDDERRTWRLVGGGKKGSTIGLEEKSPSNGSRKYIRDYIV